MFTRRDFLKTTAAGLASAALAPRAGAADGTSAAPSPAGRPNILWISCEDTSPWLGFCGEPYARTPNLDRLAAAGVRYTQAYVTAPVCSPCRFGIATGLYASSMGTQRLRSGFAVPATVHGFPSYLRQAGYYCTNNVKTDYNTSDEPRLKRESWDECSKTAHWRGRKAGQPFFAVFNLTVTHQSQAFEKSPEPLEPPERHDPAKAPLPPYYPDTPTARRVMARVHDCITAMDRRAGAVLAELEKEGLKDDTIVFFWGDHGQGIPRGKRTLWDTGLRVPLVAYLPPKYRHLAPAAPGGACGRLVSLMDLGPTMLSLAGLPVPPHMQGRAFLGPAAGPPRQAVFGARDRVDEAAELSRSVRDEKYLYIRNYMPHLSWNQPEWYSDQLDLRREITALAAKKPCPLNEAQLTYAGPTKPAEALYDCEADPWQLRNLADDSAHRVTLERMRSGLREWLLEIRDLGFLHEWQAAQLCAGGRTVWDATRDDAAYPLSRILDVADRVGRPGQVAAFVRDLADADPTIRYWAVIGLRAAEAEATAAREALAKALADASASVRIEAAGLLVAQADDAAALALLAREVAGADEHAGLHAARTLQLLGEKARPALDAMQDALSRAKQEYTRECLRVAVTALGGRAAP